MGRGSLTKAALVAARRKQGGCSPGGSDHNTLLMLVDHNTLLMLVDHIRTGINTWCTASLHDFAAQRCVNSNCLRFQSPALHAYCIIQFMMNLHSANLTQLFGRACWCGSRAPYNRSGPFRSRRNDLFKRDCPSSNITGCSDVEPLPLTHTPSNNSPGVLSNLAGVKG